MGDTLKMLEFKNSKNESGKDMVDQFMNQLRVLNADADSNFSKLVENKTIEDFIREDFKILRGSDVESRQVSQEDDDIRSNIRFQKKYGDKLVLIAGEGTLNEVEIAAFTFDEKGKGIEKFVTFLFSLFDFLEANDKATLYRKIEDELLEHNLSIAATDIFEEVKGEYASTLEDKRNGNAQGRKGKRAARKFGRTNSGLESDIVGKLDFLGELAENTLAEVDKSIITMYQSVLNTEIQEFKKLAEEAKNKNMGYEDLQKYFDEIGSNLLLTIAAIEVYLDTVHLKRGFARGKGKFDKNDIDGLLTGLPYLKKGRSSPQYRYALRIVKKDGKIAFGVGKQKWFEQRERVREKYLLGPQDDQKKNKKDSTQNISSKGNGSDRTRGVGGRLDLPAPGSRAERISITTAPKGLLTLRGGVPVLDYNRLTINQLINGVVIEGEDGETMQVFDGVLDTFNEDGSLKMGVTGKENDGGPEKIRLHFLQRMLGAEASQSARVMRLLGATDESLNPQLGFERFITILENDIINSEGLKSYESQFDVSASFLMQALRYPEAVRKQSLIKAGLGNIAAMTDGLDISNENRIYAAGLGNFLSSVGMEGVTQSTIGTFFKGLNTESENSTLIADYSRRVFQDKVDDLKENGVEGVVERAKIGGAPQLAAELGVRGVENNLLTTTQAQSLPRYMDNILEFAENGTDLASTGMLIGAGAQFVVGAVRWAFGGSGSGNFDSMRRYIGLKRKDANGAADRGLNLGASAIGFTAMSETAEFARAPSRWIDKTLGPESQLSAVGAMLIDSLETERDMIHTLRNPYVVVGDLDAKNKETILDMSLRGLTGKELAKVISVNESKKISIDQELLKGFLMRSRPLIATLSDQELDTWIRNATLTAEYAINEKSGEGGAYEYEKLEEMFESDRVVRDIMDEVGIERSRERDVSLSIAAKTVLPAGLGVEEKEMEALKSSMKNMEESEREQVGQVMQFIDTQYGLINTESKLNDAMVGLNPVVHDNTEMKGAANIHKRLMVKDTAGVTGRKRLNDILKSMVIVDVHTPEVYENLQQEYLKTLQILYGGDIVEDKVGGVTVMTSEWNEFVSKVFFPQNQSSSQTFGTRYESGPVSAKYGQIDGDDIDTATSVDELDDDTYIMEPGVDTIDTQRKDI